MAVARNALLLDQLRESGLLRPEQVEQLARLPEAREPDPRALARLVLQRGWLTRFQVTQVARGRGDELHVGPYLLLDRLGEGGMGQVFKAQHQHMSRTVALKLIRKDRLSNPRAVSRFRREVQAAAQLNHPNIVLAYDAGEAGGTHFLSMEYVEGRDLYQLLHDVGPLPVAQACDYVRQAALGLGHAHGRGIVHRDIKPQNLLVTAPAPGCRWGTVKVLDMGLSRWQQALTEEERGLTRDGAVLGTVDFMAPEQARNAHAADGRADLYSLGCTFFYLLTGHRPFHAESAAELLLKHQSEEARPLEAFRADVPAGVAAVVQALLAKRPEDRYQTAAELAAELEPFCGAEGAAAELRPASAPAPLRTEEMTWASIVDGDRPAGRAGRGSGADDETQLESGDEPPPRERKVQRRPAGAAGGRMLVFGLAGGAAVLGIGLLAVAAVIVGRFAPAKASAPQAAFVPLLDSRRAGDARPDTRPAATQPGGGRVQPEPPLAPDVPAGGLPEVTLPDVRIPAPVVKEPHGLNPAETAPAPGRFEGHTAKVTAVAFLPDGQHAVSAGYDRTVRLWDVRTGQEVGRFNAAGQVTALAVSSDGSQVLVGGLTEQAQVWNVGGSGGPSLGQPQGTTVTAAAFAPDARRAVLCNANGGVLLWEKTGGVQALRVPRWGAARAVATSADGRFAVFGCEDGTARLWDLELQQEKSRIAGHAGAVLAVALAADGRRALAGAAEGAAWLWDTATGKELRRLRGHKGRVQGVALSPDGRLALTGGADGTVRLWDARKGVSVGEFTGHDGPVTSVAFAPDGRWALSGGEDRTVRLWDLAKAADKP